MSDALKAGAKLEEAAYTARERAVMALGPEAGPLVGIPVTVRAEPQQAANVSPRGSMNKTSPHTQAGDTPAPETQSEFG